MNMVETILVTGATGNAGNEVIKQLLTPAFSSSGHNRIKAAFHSQNKVDAMTEGFYSIRGDRASRTTTVVEQITGRKPISFFQLVKDYTRAFR
jgi:uncharacterized protein YbjT (DUF2867 family)